MLKGVRSVYDRPRLLGKLETGDGTEGLFLRRAGNNSISWDGARRVGKERRVLAADWEGEIRESKKKSGEGSLR
jgi:hypothetical protein